MTVVRIAYIPDGEQTDNTRRSSSSSTKKRRRIEYVPDKPVAAESKPAAPTIEQAFPMLPNLNQSINNMNDMAKVGKDTLKLGIVAPQPNAFKTLETPSSDLLRSNTSVRAFTPIAHGAVDKIKAVIGQAKQGAQNAVLYGDMPTSERPSTGSKALDEFARGTGEFAAGAGTMQPGVAFGPIARGVTSVTSKLAGKLGKEAPAVANKILGAAAEGAVENARLGAGAGQTDAGQVATNLGYGAGFGAGGAVIGQAIKGAGRYVQKIARETTADNLAYQNIVREIGESSAKAEIGKRNLADLDEQIQSLSSGNVANKADQFNALAGERNAVIDYIKQHEPDFEAPKPRVRASNQQPPVARANEPIVLTADNPTATMQTGTAPKVEHVPGVTEPKTNKSSYYNTIERSGQLNPETQAALNQVDQSYEQIHNVDTVAQANERVKDLKEASRYAVQEGKLTAEQVATGIRAMQEHQRLGNVESAVNLAQNLARKLTEAGQALQVSSIIDRLSPEGALIYAQRKVADINRRLPKGAKDVKITPAIAEDIIQVATASQKAGASDERAGDVLSILQKLRAGKEVSAEERATLQSFVDDAAQFTKKETKERKLPEALSEPRKRDKIISFLEQQEAAAKERLRQRKGAANSLPLDVWADYAYIGALKLARNTVKFADWSEAMVRDIGDEVKPYLERLFQSSHDKLAEQAERITSRPKTARQVANDELKAAVEDIQGDVLAAIEKSKAGKLDPQEFEDLITKANDVAELLPESKAPNPDKEMLNTIKQLVKKLAGVESEKIAPDIAFREVKDLVRRITNIGKELETRTRRTPLDTKALDDMAYGLLDRATPSEAEKVTTRYIKKNIDNLSPDDIELIHGMAKNVSRLSKEEQRVASQDLQAIMNNFEKVGIGRKISAAQYISLLLNPLTQIKNVVGNDMLYRFNRLGRVLSTPVDMAISKATGTPRQITFKSGPSVWDDFFKTTKDYFQGLERGGKAGAKGTNPEGLTTAYDIGGKAFTHKLNPLNYLESALGATMKGFDYAAYNRAVQQRMREMAYLDAINKKIPKDQIRSHIDTYVANIDDNVAAIAKEYGKKITLQDDSMLARGLTAVKRGLNFGKDFGLGNLVVPFAKTPANLLNRAIDYSPAGFIKAVYNLNKVLRSRETDLTRADVIQNVVEAVLGTGVTGVALWLADKGVLRGSSTFDKDTKSLEKKAGLGEFQLNATALQRMLGAIATGNLNDVDEASKLQPGDNMYAYAWAQPLSMPVAVGSNIVKSIKDTKRAAEKGQKAPSKLLQAIDVTTGGLNTLYSSSVLEGLQNAFDFQTGDTNQIKSFFKNVIKQVPSMAVPSFVRMLNTISDNQQRELYSDSYTKGLLNQATSKIPGLAQKLPVKRDSLGDPVTVPNNFADTFLNPAKRSVYNPDSNAEFIINLINETGDESIAPRVPDKTLSGTDLASGKTKSVALTGEQYSILQKLIGEHVAIGISKIKNVGTTEDKVKAIKKVLNEAGTYGRNILKKEVGLKQSK